MGGWVNTAGSYTGNNGKQVSDPEDSVRWGSRRARRSVTRVTGVAARTWPGIGDGQIDFQKFN